MFNVIWTCTFIKHFIKTIIKFYSSSYIIHNIIQNNVLINLFCIIFNKVHNQNVTEIFLTHIIHFWFILKFSWTQAFDLTQLFMSPICCLCSPVCWGGLALTERDGSMSFSQTDDRTDEQREVSSCSVQRETHTENTNHKPQNYHTI